MSDEQFFREIRETMIDDTRKMLENAGADKDNKGPAKENNKSKSGKKLKDNRDSLEIQHPSHSQESKTHPSLENVGVNKDKKALAKENNKSLACKKPKDSGEREIIFMNPPTTLQELKTLPNLLDMGRVDVTEPVASSSGLPERRAGKVTFGNVGEAVNKSTKENVTRNPNSKSESEEDEPPLGLPELRSHKVVQGKTNKKQENKKNLREANKHPDSRKSNTKPIKDDVADDRILRLSKKINQLKNDIDDIKKTSKEYLGRPKHDSSTPRHDLAATSTSKNPPEKKEKMKDNKAKPVRSASETGDKKELKRKDKSPSVSNPQAMTTHEALVSDELPPEHKLLLQLFLLSSSQRRKFIESQGMELGLLDPHPYKKHVVLVNKNILPVAENLALDAKRFLAERSGSAGLVALSQERTNHHTQTATNSKQKRDGRGTYEDQINFMLNDLNSKDTSNLEMVSEEVRDKANEIMQERLDAFVERLVAKNVGYLVEGILRINARNNMQSFVDDVSRTGNVYINSILLRRCAMEGDLVRVFVKNQSPDSDEESDDNSDCENGTVKETVKATNNNAGFVVRILEKRHNRQCVGKFLPAAQGKKHYRTFAPRDMRIPPVRVFRQDWPNALLDVKPTKPRDDDRKVPQKNEPDVTEVLYQAEIIEWQDEVPIGTILKSIGKCGVLEVENESILVEHNLDVTPYGEEILVQLPAVPYTIPEEELARREDLRGECIFTIDPATARDLDDALSCKQLANGNYQIGVHISDVTYFLRESSPLDELVKLRATSIYMVDTVYHMLPKQLCNTCSLLPGEDKLAFSVFWEMQPDGTVLSTRFARTVINSCSQLSYEHAQLMLDNPNGELDDEEFPEILHGYTVQTLCKIVNTLQSIAVKLRQRRMDDGCLKINQPKLTFRLDPATGRPIEYGAYQVRPSNEMIEDFMLLANTSVANAIHKAFPAISLLRSHSPPAENMMKNLARTLSLHGYSLSYAGPKDIRECMETIITSSTNPDASRAVLSVLLAKPMIRAQYYCSMFATTPEHFMHYALAIPMYTHFTSPIRRYADCLVHRVLAAMLEIDEPPRRSPEELQSLAMICNEKKYNAKLAGEASSLLYFRHWLASVKEYETDAAVMGYAAHYIELVLIHSGIVLKAATKKLSAVSTIVFKPIEPLGSCLLVPMDKSIPYVKLTMFSKVRVTVKVVKDVITVSSILPIPQEEIKISKTFERSVDKLSAEMKSARIY
ncbi:DIS3-like exonuclease 2 [Anopheles moucheti]|uniref:DIS3-like exonuclease 2 n=1 Tax=Anopheles moucheti TaxID=186751 RepID=UPI0022F0B0A6|nr:DIS3-like exonuclease 2 [Anopheles moucheti]